MLRDSIARVLRDTCDSRALHAFWDGDRALGRSLDTEATQLGWLGAGLPEAEGGYGVEGASILSQELGRCAAPGSMTATLVAAQWISEGADAAVQDRYLPSILSEDGGFLIPADVGDELAIADGRISGETTLFGPSSARLALVVVGGGTPGVAIVELPAGPDAVRRLDPWDRSRDIFDTSFAGAEPLEFIADPHGDARQSLRRHLSLALASDSVGGAEAIADRTVEYMKTRVQFDKPIGSFQALKHRAADMAVRISVQKNLLTYALQPHSTLEEAEMWAGLAKAGAAECFAYIAGDAVQLHGGVGHTWEFDCHIYLKRARLNEALGGSAQRQREAAMATMIGLAADDRTFGEFAL